MSDNVEVTMSATDKSVLTSLTSVERALERLNSRMSTLESSSKKAAHESGSAFDGLKDKIGEASHEVTGLVAGMFTLEKAAEAVKKTLEDVAKRREKALGAQTDYATEARRFAEATAGYMTGEESDKFAKATARRAHADRTKTAAALRHAVVAGGVHDKQGAAETGKVVEQVLELYKGESAEDIGAIAAGAARLQSRLGKGAPAGAGLGMLLKIRREAGLTSVDAMSKQLVPAILEGEKAGMAPGQSGAVFAALAQGIGDPTGKLTKGAFSKLTEELESHFPGQNPADLIAKMQGGNTKLYQRFMHEDFVKGADGVGHQVPGAHFDDKSKSAVMAFLTGKNAAGKPTDDIQRFQRIQAGLTDANAGQKFVDDVKANFRGIPAVRVAEAKEGGEAGAKELQLGATRDARIAQVAEVIESQLSAAGFWWGRRATIEAEFQRRVTLGGEDPSKVGQDVFRSLAKELDNPPPMFKNWPGQGKSPPIYAPEPEKAQLFRDQADLMQENDEAENPTPAISAEKNRQSTGEPVTQFGGTLPRPPGTGGEGGTLRSADPVMRRMAAALDQLVAQGRGPTEVVDVGRRTEYATTSYAGAALSG
jgi:hypothetical protein